jgi:hypothetical protein
LQAARAGRCSRVARIPAEREWIAVTITRVGTNQKYSEGWEQAFSGKRGGSAKPAAKATAKKASPKKPAKKSKK